MTRAATDNGFRGTHILFRPERVEAALWRRHLQQRSPQTRQALFDHYRRFAERLAKGQFARRLANNFDFADVQQLAYEALLEAIERYDPARGIAFEAYARLRIKGHITSGLIQSSEANAQINYRIRVERERLRSLQDGLGDTAEDPIAALSSLSVTLAIGLMLEPGGPEDLEAIPDPAPSSYDSLAWNQLVGRVHELIDGLPEREAYVMRQHYHNGVSFQQLAELLGVTKGRISQIHRAALQYLQSLLAKHL